MHLFIATDAIETSSQHLDKNEHITLMKVPVETAVDMVMDGRITANSTAHLILKVAELQRREQLQKRGKL